MTESKPTVVKELELAEMVELYPVERAGLELDRGLGSQDRPQKGKWRVKC